MPTKAIGMRTQELELQATVSLPIVDIGNELRFSARAVCILLHCLRPSFQPLMIIFVGA